jgi:tRNA A37 threonylcarbamoyladenosine synthetase subunit TsaC/SUA5/YrdC
MTSQPVIPPPSQISSLEMLHDLYPAGWKMPDSYSAAISAFWPGPLTILLPRR